MTQSRQSLQFVEAQRLMKLIPLAAAALTVFPIISYSQVTIEYDVSFPNAAHHEARISVKYSKLNHSPLELRMSRSSPGRYAIHEFAKNVYEISAVDVEGNSLSMTRPNPYQWNVPDHDGEVTVTYTLYADHLDGTYSAIDLTHAHLNMPATLMWARGLDDLPVTVRFHPARDDWKVATQLAPTDEPFVYESPNLQYLMDSPTELSNFSERTWTVDSNGKPYEIRLAVHHDGIEEDVDVFLAQAQKVVAEQISVFGELPELDYGTYTFICDFLPYAEGDGMEHRNSTVITFPQSLIDVDFNDQLATLSHEFIHTWNAERIRPSRLEPFDFEQANMSLNLWFMEGFTSYYGPLTIRRAGESTIDEYLEQLAAIIHTVTYSPGRSFASSRGMSAQAPFVDDASSIDKTNFSNIYISYYTYGAAIGMALDLTLRESYKDTTLDSMMQLVWERHGTKEDTYTTADLEQVLALVTSDVDFAAEFFARYIKGQDLPNYTSLLANAAFLIKKENEGAASVGPITLEFEGKAAIVAANSIIGSPLYQAGIDRGDQIYALDRIKIQSQEQWDMALERYKPGDTAIIDYRQREIDRSAELTFVEDDAMIIVKYEDDGIKASRSQLRFRGTWLGPEVDEGDDQANMP
jgi:predicted metalloprotease with PDZ domain